MHLFHFYKRKTKFKYLFLINLTLICILVSISSRFNIFQISQPYFEIKNPIIYTFINESKHIGVFNPSYSCNPYNQNATNFNINIHNRTYPHITPIYENKTLNLTCLNSDPQIKTILLWNKFRGDPIFDYGEGVRDPFILNKCPVTNCELTSDRSKLNKSDLVLFHMRSRIEELPLFRFDLQRWVYVIYESSQHCPLCGSSRFNGLFNLSATYKLKSDFTSIYLTDSKMTWEPPNKNYAADDYLSKKTKFSFGVISSCEASSRRLEYIDELKKFINVDVYGKCATDLDKVCTDEKNDVCGKEYLSSVYKFYFAFENSICDDYVTEKFFKILQFNVIPIVLGGAADYSVYVPKTAYINVFDYETPKDLANYLLHLSSNKTAYNSYFEWKKYIKFNVIKPFQAHICEMCIKLHLEKYTGIERKQIGDVNEYMGMNTNCKGLKVSYIRKFDWLASPEYLTMKLIES